MKYRFLWCWKISKLSFCLGKVGKVWKDGKTRLRIRLVVCPDLDVIVKSMDFSTSPEHSKHFASFTHSHTFMQACLYTWVLRAPSHNQQGALILRSVPLKQADRGADNKRTGCGGKSDEKSLQSHSGGNPGPQGCSSSSLTYISWAQSFSGKSFCSLSEHHHTDSWKSLRVLSPQTQIKLHFLFTLQLVKSPLSQVQSSNSDLYKQRVAVTKVLHIRSFFGGKTKPSAVVWWISGFLPKWRQEPETQL